MQSKPKTFTQKCIENSINYEAAVSYRHKHQELTDEQIIIRFKPELSINVFGEIIK